MKLLSFDEFLNESSKAESFKDRHNSFIIDSMRNQFQYQIPYLLVGQSEDLGFDPDDLDREVRRKLNEIANDANDEINTELEKVQKKIIDIGKKAVAEAKKLK